MYLNCNFCDKDYIIHELKFLNHVRDLRDANVVVLGISENIGNGGTKYRFIFEGRDNFNGLKDTLIFNTTFDASTDEIRNAYLTNLKMGLLPYILKTPIKDKINISITPINAEKDNQINYTDPWKNWIFAIGLQNNISGEESSNSINLYSSIKAHKITEKHKFNIVFSKNFSKRQYSYNQYQYTFLNTSNSGYVYYVYSLGEHWSLGAFTSTGNSTFSNYDFYASLYPAIEYNVFPYKKSFEKQLRISYRIGPNYYDYTDTTIYLKTKELIAQHKMDISVGLIKNWGEINLSIWASQFLHNPEFYSLGTYIYLSARLVKGLSVNFYGGYSMLRNQINLSKSSVTQEELLLQQRQIKTNFSYWNSAGISYSFGSKYSNVVNPRFE